MAQATITLSTAEARREVVVASAIEVFAQTGYLGTPVAAIAEHAGISTAYVFKLFPAKENLFAAALERSFAIVLDALERGADSTEDQSPDSILFAMGGSYAELIADRSQLMLQVHAQSAANVPAIGDALRAGMRSVTEFARARSKAPDAAVQRFIAYGQLCHLIVVSGIENDPASWARALTDGIRHP